MAFITIILKEFIQGFRDKKNFILMILMPTILTILLSAVFKEEIFTNNDFSNIKVKYLNESNDMFNNTTIINEVLQSVNIDLEVASNETSYDKAKDIIILQNNNEIKFIYDKQVSVQGSIISNMIKSSLLYVENTNDYISMEKQSNKIHNVSLNYYGVTMITLTIFFSAVTGAYSIIKEKNENTVGKLLTLPITLEALIFGKIIGALILSFFQVLIVIGVMKYFLHVYLGNSIVWIILLLLTESMLSISFGTFIGTLVKDNKSCWILLLSIIMIFGLLGGAFVPLSDMNGYVIDILSKFSPITYVNSAIFSLIYIDNIASTKLIIFIFIVISIILTILSSLILGGKNESNYYSN